MGCISNQPVFNGRSIILALLKYLIRIQDTLTAFVGKSTVKTQLIGSTAHLRVAGLRLFDRAATDGIWFGPSASN